MRFCHLLSCGNTWILRVRRLDLCGLRAFHKRNLAKLFEHVRHQVYCWYFCASVCIPPAAHCQFPVICVRKVLDSPFGDWQVGSFQSKDQHYDELFPYNAYLYSCCLLPESWKPCSHSWVFRHYALHIHSTGVYLSQVTPLINKN